MTTRTLGVTSDHHDLAELAGSFAEFAKQEDLDPRSHTTHYLGGGLPHSWGELIDTGLHSVHIPEEYGGGGAGIVELAIVLEQFASELYPGPLLPTVATSAVVAEIASAHIHKAAAQALRNFSQGSTGAVVSGNEIQATYEGGQLRLRGVANKVIGALAADVFVVSCNVQDTQGWVILSASEVKVEPTEGVDLTRDRGKVTVDLEIDPERHLFDAQKDATLGLIKTLQAAEASGVGAGVTDLAIAHAKMRTQFRRQLSSFQALQQRLSMMYVHTETMRAVVWDMARRTREQRQTAALAGADLAVTQSLRNTFEYVMTLGAIGFTWEHDAHLYWRRVIELGIIDGPGAVREHNQGLKALQEEPIVVTVAESDDLPELRKHVRDALHRAGDPSDGGTSGSAWAPRRDSKWQQSLARDRLVAPHLPEPYGQGAGALAQAVILEEFSKAGVVPPTLVIGDWVAPTIAEHGTHEQQERFLPPTLRGDIVWCQLFSEPGAGSDLGSLSTRATPVTGGWKVSGQKIWNSIADIADWGAILVRTDPDLRGSRGLGYMLIEMDSPGVDVRPIRQATGLAEFCEVFLDDVFVPENQVVGEPGDGWKIATTTLSNERLRMGEDLGHGASWRFRELVDNTDPGSPLWNEIVTALGRAVIREYGLAALGARGAVKRISGMDVSSETSVLKLANIIAQRKGSEELIRLSGPEQLIEHTISGAQDHHGIIMDYLGLPAILLGGGTPDIQLGVIAGRMLGLR